jgi:type I restriction enzyme R subunit
MIARYIVITSSNILKILRSYQVYATEALVDRVKNSTTNGYIWHTTGSGKTLTSFKASQIIMRLPKVHKVVFVVDRKDLDYQTAKEFNKFSKGSVDSTTNTNHLIEQLNNDIVPLIVTTIQKLNNAIVKECNLDKIKHLQNKKFVFIFDECHRSQFGETHRNIKKFFQNAQMFGFTGTPILADNAFGTKEHQLTTKSLFDECLHKYVIVDVAYILNLLRNMSRTNPAESQKRRQQALDLMTGEIQLCSKRDLIEEFIENDLSKLNPDEDVAIAFENYWLIKKAAAFNELCTTENLQNKKLEEIIKTYNFANRLPRDQEIRDALNFQPKILDRKTIIERVSQKITDFIDTFIECMGGTV